MRFALTIAATLFLGFPTYAQAIWGYYQNPRYAYGIDLPPGFEGQGESQNGDGQVFLFDGRVARLTVWGGFFSVEPDLESEAAWRLAEDTASGWDITAQSTTPTWATWSATKSGRVLHQHMIRLCDGDSYAAMRLDYAQTDRPKIDPIVDQLTASLVAIC